MFIAAHYAPGTLVCYLPHLVESSQSFVSEEIEV